jgi:hypothetical protein
MISDININNGSRRSMFQRIKNVLKTHWLLLVCLGTPIVIESGVALMHVARDRFGRGAQSPYVVCCLPQLRQLSTRLTDGCLPRLSTTRPQCGLLQSSALYSP